jgi:hypothetical protein
LGSGEYTLKIQDGILGETGQALDGNLDGIPGGNFERAFTIANVLPSGSEEKINSLVSTRQRSFTPVSATEAYPDQLIGSLPDGGYVVTWSSEGQNGDAGWGVYARRYSADGTPVGSEFRVNETITSDQSDAAIAVDGKGNFVITWNSLDQDGSGWGIYARRYDMAGNPLGSEFRINSYSYYHQRYPSIASDVAGNFVIVWSDYQDDYGGVYGQRFNASGVAQGSEFSVNTTKAGYQSYPSVGMDGDGDFVVTWSSYGQDTNGYWTNGNWGVYGQRFNKQGGAVDGEFLVNQTVDGQRLYSRVGVDRAGNFVVVWEGQSADGSYDIYARRYNASGEAQGNGEFKVNRSIAKDQRHAMIDMSADGDFVITWSSQGQDASGWGVYAQRYSASGVPQGDEFRVNSTIARDQRYSAVSLDNNGNFVIAWNSQNSNSTWDIMARRYVSNPAPVAGTILNQTVMEDVPFTFQIAPNTFVDTDTLTLMLPPKPSQALQPITMSRRSELRSPRSTPIVPASAVALI